MLTVERLVELTDAELIAQDKASALKLEVPAIAVMPDQAQPEELALVFPHKAGKAIKLLGKSNANVIILSANVKDEKAIQDFMAKEASRVFLFVPRPRYALQQIVSFYADARHEPGAVQAHKRPSGAFIHPSAVIDPSAELGPGVVIGPFVYIGPESKLGANTKLHSRVSVGSKVTIGEDCNFSAGVVIEDRVEIANRVIVHANTVIGSDGYSFVTKEPTNLEKMQAGDFTFNMDRQVQEKIISAGTVIIEDDVEIGSNTSIDRGTLGATKIGTGTKIDNLVQIAHNVEIGKDCLIIANVGIAGSVKVGDRVTIAGSSGIGDGVEIANDVTVGAFAAVNSNLDPFVPVLGIPAVPYGEFINRQRAIARLPRHQKEFREFKSKLEKLDHVNSAEDR